MASTSALVVPIFIWHAPPSHNVTASYLSLEHGRFITASDKGHIVLWKFSPKNEQRKLEPQVMCFTTEAVAISALEMGPYNERECLISVSENGSIFVWSLTDGQCQVSRSNVFKCTPTSLKLLPDRRHVAVAGHSPTVEILDLMTMRVVRKLGPHFDWLCAIDWVMHSRQPMLVSVSLDNLYRQWMLDEEMLKSLDSGYQPSSNAPREEYLANMIVPLTEDRSASLGKPRQALVGPSGCSLLIVHEKQVSVYPMPFTNTTPAWHIRSKIPFISAHWCDDLTVLIFNALGQGFIHRLPKSVLPMTAQSSSSASYSSMLFGAAASHHSNATPTAQDSTTQSLSPSSNLIPQSLLTKRMAMREAGHLHELFKIPSSWKPSLQTENGTLLAELTVPEAIRRTFAVTEIHPGCVDNTVYLVHGNGQVIVWELPLVWDRDMVQSQIPPSFESRLSEGWSTHSYGSNTTTSTSMERSSSFNASASRGTLPVLNLSQLTGGTQNGLNESTGGAGASADSMNVESGSIGGRAGSGLFAPPRVPGTPYYNANSAFVTASMVLEKKLQLISGYSDGTITTSKLPLDMNPRTWRAHNNRINALLLIPFDNKEYLVSGSSDFYIKVWDLEAEPPVLVHCFANHCGPVRSLFAPDPQDIRRRGWASRFFSIGEDRIVGLYGVDRTPHCVRVFPNHPAAIQEVRWRPDEDYLLVQCKDGSISIWEMESGTLENSVRGKDAEGVMSFAKPLSKGEPGSSLKPVARQSITGVSIPIEGESPVQAVLLNIKYLSQDLAEHLQAYDQQRQLHIAKMREASGKPAISPRGLGPSIAATTHSAVTSTLTSSTGVSAATTRSASDKSSPAKDEAPGSAPKSMKLPRGNSGKIGAARGASSRELNKTTPAAPQQHNDLLASSTSNLHASQDAIQGSLLAGGHNPRMSLFLSAAQLGAYRSCAYLLPWGLDQDLDQLVIAQLYLKPPKPPVSYGMLGVDGNMSVLVPRASELAGRWQCSDSLTAIHSLASVAIAKCLLAFDVNESLYSHEQRNASSHLMSYFCVFLPEKVVDYIYPSLTVLAAFWQDPLEDILQAARAIFSSVLNRLSHEQRRMLAIAWGNLLTRNTNISSATNTPTKMGSSDGLSSTPTRSSAVSGPPTSAFLRNQSVLVLSILGCEYPESLPTDMAANVALELLEIIFEASNSRMRVAAAELFGKGFQLWSQHLHEEASSLIHRLFKLAMVSEPKNLSKTAARALMLIGEKIPTRFTQAIHQRFSDLIKSGGTTSSASSISSSSSSSSSAASMLSSLTSSASIPTPGNMNTPSKGSASGVNNGSSSGGGMQHSSSYSGGVNGGALQGILAVSADAISPPSTPTAQQPSAYLLSLKEHAKVLVILARLVKAHRVDFYPELPTLVEAIVKSLHPHIPGLRDATLATGTSLLNLMVSLYPMLAIDLGEQRLAVGTRDGQVHVYDLSQATRVHTLQCHAPYSVSAVAFAGANKVLATYSIETGQLKVWKTTQSLFGILSGEPQAVKTFDIPSSCVVPPLSVSGAEPTVTVVKLKNLSDMAPPSSKTLRDMRQKKVDKISSSGSSTPAKPALPKLPGSPVPYSPINYNSLLDGLVLSWPNTRLLNVERKWEDPALAVLQFPV